MFDSKTMNIDVAALVDSYNDRKTTLTDIAKQLGCSIPTASRLLKKNGAQMRAKGRPKGSKTVNRKPKVTAATTLDVKADTSAELPSGAEEKVENLAETAVIGKDTNFTTFQQKVMSFKQTA